MAEWIALATLPAAFALDLLLGDPPQWPHPVRWMGRAITAAEPLFRALPLPAAASGALFAGALVAGTWIAARALTALSSGLDPLLGWAVEVALITTCLAGRSLDAAGREIHGLLAAGRVDAAREKVALIVGRDVDRYGAEDIARATVETVAENTVDGLLSPLLFAALGGAPLALAFKMVSTLDSMVGYRSPRYRDFGKASARLDDAANFLPARLALVPIALAAELLGGTGRRSLETALAEGMHHQSPNAGWPEAAFAGALGVKLNGPNFYGGVLVEKPFIGVRFGAVRLSDIPRACDLLLLASIAALPAAVALAWLRNAYGA
jgi:adenosylcobinamide-phosphate synthase